jgi:hypothetical protein
MHLKLHHEVQLHLQGTAAYTRYCYTKRNSYTTRHGCTYEIQLHLRGTAIPARYSYTCEVRLQLYRRVQLHLRDTVYLRVQLHL